LFSIGSDTEGFVEWAALQDNDGKPLFLSSSGKLNLAFSLGGDAVARDPLRLRLGRPSKKAKDEPD
jgi:hypothetical protein